LWSKLICFDCIGASQAFIESYGTKNPLCGRKFALFQLIYKFAQAAPPKKLLTDLKQMNM
jgi:hypothetical protein